MAIAQAVCNSFKAELLGGVHDFDNGVQVFKLALFQSNAVLDQSTTSFSNTNEAAVGGQYVTGGSPLISSSVSLSASTAIVTFADLSFTGVTLTADGALIYASTGGKAVCVLSFGGDKTATSGTFTIVFPAFTAANAILRIA